MKERMLTVLVPIKDSDATVVSTLPDIDPDNINVIYKNEGVYKRIWLNPATNQYEYHEVIDREFPYLGKPLEVFDFTYDATRMGTAPTISAQGIMWYADKDTDGNDVTLEGLWSQECHVTFNGENFYLKQIPTSSKSNEDARYKYDIDFVSERVVLEQVYLYDVVQPFITERPLSESATFSFFGDITELAKRINTSLIRSGLATIMLRDNQAETVHPRLLADGVTHAADDQYFTYEEWNAIKMGTYNGELSTTDPYNSGNQYGDYDHYHNNIFDHYNGDYNAYLRNEVFYLDGDGNIVISGYQCRIGKDKKGELTSSDEKLITFENNTIHEALQQVHDTFELQYYITRERDINGDFTGNTLIMIADCEHDFADVDGDDYVRDADGIPTTEHPFEYGVEDALLSKEKTNTTEKIITRITGTGSEENIPWYYPNPTADGWIKPVYKTNGVVQEIEVDYPTSEENVRYEKYLKNRIGDVFEWGDVRILKNYSQAASSTGLATNTSFEVGFVVDIDFDRAILWSDIACKICNNISYRMKKDGVDYEPEPSFDIISGHGHLPQGHYVIYYMWSDDNPIFSPQENIYYYYHGASWITTGFSTIPNLKHYYRRDGRLIAEWWYTGDDPSQNHVDLIVPQINTFYYAYHNNDPSNNLVDEHYWTDKGHNNHLVTEGVPASVQYIISHWLSGSIKVKIADGWYKNSKEVNLADFGITEDGEWTPDVFDTIEFQRLKYITPQPTLMPELYIKTDGERRFYNAINYPLASGTPDAMIGEEESGGQIINPLYYKEDSTTHYDFENEYVKNIPKEHIEAFDDVKPTIKGHINTVDGQSFRIDVVEEFGYDEFDNDEIWESNEDGNVSGEYKHPYFFAKLRPLGFNLFDLALQDDMVLSMTTGHCGACNFKIGVDENTKKNPVQIWEYDVYGGPTYELRGDKLYAAGTLRRYVDTSTLYYDTDGTTDGYIPVNTRNATRPGFLVDTNRSFVFQRSVYSAEEITNGEVGSLKQDGKTHSVGDVVTNGRFIDSQQDTSENYVWVALMKDTDTYGVLMPSARPDYGDGNYSVYIRPNSVADVHTEESTASEDEENADKFVLVNIRMPQVYLREAERELSRKIVAYMYDNNYQKFNFSIDFSRIFLADNQETENDLNENSVLYVSFNNKTYRQYVKHYTYRMSHDVVLPEIKVDMNEELSVSRTQAERQNTMLSQISTQTSRRLRREITNTENRISRNTIGKNEDAIISGNLVSRDAVTSFIELNNTTKSNTHDVFDTQIDLAVNHYRKEEFNVVNGNELRIGDDISVPTKGNFDSFVGKVNTFNTNVSDSILRIRYTVEDRVGKTQSGGCSNLSKPLKERTLDLKDNAGIAFWLDKDGNSVSTSGVCPVPFIVEWTNFNVS